MKTSLFKGVVCAAAITALPALGAAQTVLRIDGGTHDRAGAVTTDATGNAYVVGQVPQSGVSSFSVTKYASNGVVTWRRAYSGAAGGGTTGYATSVAVDASGNVYAAGYVWFGGTTLAHLDSVLVKFDASGNELWSRRYNGTGHGYDVASHLKLAPNGTVHVGLRSAAAGGNFDGVTLAYSSTGELLRERSFTSPGPSDDEIVGMAVDAQSNLIVVGRSSNASGIFGSDVRTIKYGPTGDVVWQRNFTVTAMSDEQPAGMALDASGSVYVVGIEVASSSPEQEQYGMLLRYDASGNQTLAITNARAGGQSVAIDVNGDIVVSGMPLPDFAVPLPGVARYTSSGELLWHRLFPVNGVALFAPFRLVLDEGGNAFVGGTYNESGPNRDYMLAKVAPGGAILWQYRYNGTGNGVDDVFDLARDPFNALYLTGTSRGASNDDIVTVAVPAGFAPPAGAPAAPGALAATSVAANRVVLQWQDRSSDEDGFRVERCSGAGCTNFATIATLAAGATGFTDTNVVKNAKHSYRVRAFNGVGASAPSNVLSITTPKK